MKKALTNYRIWLFLQAVALLIGNIVGWTTISREVQIFCDQQSGGWGALLTFSGTTTTNPLITPCFWGSVIFIITLAWTLSIIFEKQKKEIATNQKRLVYVLGGGTAFALLNNIPIFYKYFTRPSPATGQVSCSADVVSNPLLTSCFLGFIAFLAAFICSMLAKKYLENNVKA